MMRHHMNYLFQNKKKEKTIELTLDKVGLKDLMNQMISTLSGGQQQRITVARIILKPSDIILANEPIRSLHLLPKKLDIIMIIQNDFNLFFMKC